MFLSVNTFQNIGRFILVLLIFVFVLALTYFTTRYVANFQQKKIVNGNIKVLETFQIAQTKYIQLVSVGKKYFVIAVSKDNITLLGQVDEDDIDLTGLNDNKMPSFKDIIEKAKQSLDKNQQKSDDEQE